MPPSRCTTNTGLPAKDIRRVRVLVPQEVVKTVCEPIENKRNPANSYDAQFSIPYIVATGLLKGRFTLAELEDKALGDAAVLNLASRVDYAVDHASTFPRHYTGEVIVETEDGRSLRHREAVNRGCADRPLSNDEVVAKFFDNAERAVARGTAERVARCGPQTSIVRTPARSPTSSAPGAEEQAMDAVTDKVETAANEHLVLDMVDKFLATEVKPHVHALEHDDVYPADIVEKMKEMGLFGCVIAPEYGGLGLSTIDLREDHRAHLGGVDVDQRHHQLAPDHGHGGAAQRHRAAEGGVPAALRDRRVARRRGLDRARLRHRPAGDTHRRHKRVGDDYVVNGRKTWITNSLYGNCLALLVKTDPNAKPRHRGMSLLIAEKGPGFTVNRKLRKARLQGHRYLRAQLRRLQGARPIA